MSEKSSQETVVAESDYDASLTTSSATKEKAERSAMAAAAAAVVAALAILVGVIVGLSALGGASSTDNEAASVKSGQYQAVFLTNGQVYFGKLAGVNDHYYRLTDIYYLQVQTATTTETPAPSNDVQKSADPSQASQTQLVKLGDELHGPEDAMQIDRDQVQFWENLKSDGKVAQAIVNFKKQ